MLGAEAEPIFGHLYALRPVYIVTLLPVGKLHRQHTISPLLQVRTNPTNQSMRLMSVSDCTASDENCNTHGAFFIRGRSIRSGRNRPMGSVVGRSLRHSYIAVRGKIAANCTRRMSPRRREPVASSLSGQENRPLPTDKCGVYLVDNGLASMRTIDLGSAASRAREST